VCVFYPEAGVVWMQVAALVGICYFVVAIFRLSYLANFLSHSVISGFTSGAACIIGIMQLKYFFGFKIPNTETALKAIIELSRKVLKGESKWREMLMFAFFLTLLLTMKKLSQNYKKLFWMRPLGPITSAVLGILAVKLDKKGLIKTVKTVPKGALAS
jgi:MFS superfamily sulfate permease-like transporter